MKHLEAKLRDSQVSVLAATATYLSLLPSAKMRPCILVGKLNGDSGRSPIVLRHSPDCGLSLSFS